MLRPLTILLLALLLAAPSAALAQTDDEQLSDDPPATLNGDATPEPADDGAGEEAPAEAAPAGKELPDTGAEPMVVALLGGGLLLAGAGLRLRLEL